MMLNHVAAKLSDLDLEMAKHVPPGGNWKNIPKHIPSRRLENIRKSFAEGKGSRSTYYGRLLPDKPSYTINTYFSRLGNGCHLHYDFEQQRVLSQREAARLQGFPDSFVFVGSKTSINKQIGNAVPPILAYQIALQLGKPGIFIDLFSGAGGLALGFIWAGWKSVVANDIDGTFLETYKRNIDSEVIVGDIRDKEVVSNIITKAKEAKKNNPELPLIVIGGPPCQGFSTAGNKRSMEDDRNHLYLNYKEIVEKTKADACIFENVIGLLNMDGGAVLQTILTTLRELPGKITLIRLNAVEFGVPQKRERVFIIGIKNGVEFKAPKRLNGENPHHAFISVKEALSDLPPLKSGEDGAELGYLQRPITTYQKFMRGIITIKEYINSLN